MRQIISAGFLVFLSAAAAGTALAANGTTSQTLIALEHQWVHAAEAGDKATLKQILAPDFVDVSWRGQIRSRADLLATHTVPAASPQKLIDLKVRLYGDTAIVNGLNVGNIKGRRFTIRFTDVFVSQHGRWRAVSAQETLVRPGNRSQ